MKKFVIIAAACLLLIASAISAQAPPTEPPAIPSAGKFVSATTVPTPFTGHSTGTFQPIVVGGSIYAINTATGELWRSGTTEWTRINGKIPQE